MRSKKSCSIRIFAIITLMHNLKKTFLDFLTQILMSNWWWNCKCEVAPICDKLFKKVFHSNSFEYWWLL